MCIDDRGRAGRESMLNLGGNGLRTVDLPDGSIVPLVDVTAVRAHPHFWSRRYYVQVELRNGSTRLVDEQLSREAAQEKKAEVVAAVHQAANEVDPYLYGYEAGFGRGKVEGRSEGFGEGHSQGLGEGRASGYAEAQRSIFSSIYQWREGLIQERADNVHHLPSRRRYVRNAIAAVTDLIQHLSPEDPSISSPD